MADDREGGFSSELSVLRMRLAAAAVENEVHGIGYMASGTWQRVHGMMYRTPSIAIRHEVGNEVHAAREMVQVR